MVPAPPADSRTCTQTYTPNSVFLHQHITDTNFSYTNQSTSVVFSNLWIPPSPLFSPARWHNPTLVLVPSYHDSTSCPALHLLTLDTSRAPLVLRLSPFRLFSRFVFVTLFFHASFSTNFSHYKYDFDFTTLGSALSLLHLRRRLTSCQHLPLK